MTLRLETVFFGHEGGPEAMAFGITRTAAATINTAAPALAVDCQMFDPLDARSSPMRRSPPTAMTIETKRATTNENRAGRRPLRTGTCDKTASGSGNFVTCESTVRRGPRER